MPNWVISLPAWNPHYIEVCTQLTIPAVRAALNELVGEHQVEFIVHTSRPAYFEAALGDYPVTFARVPKGRTPFDQFAAAHREAMAFAPIGSNVVLLNADIVVSKEIFALADRLFWEGYRALATVGTRTLYYGSAPIGVDARTLSEWSWQFRHGIARACEWETGRTALPTVLFFSNGPNVVEHCFHLCPVVFHKDRRALEFAGTIDDDLLSRFTEEETYVVKDLECAMAELSRSSKVFHLGEKLNADVVAKFARKFRPRHLWNGSHGILIAGQRDGVDTSPMHEIFARIEYYKSLPIHTSRPLPIRSQRVIRRPIRRAPRPRVYV